MKTRFGLNEAARWRSHLYSAQNMAICHWGDFNFVLSLRKTGETRIVRQLRQTIPKKRVITFFSNQTRQKDNIRDNFYNLCFGADAYVSFFFQQSSTYL